MEAVKGVCLCVHYVGLWFGVFPCTFVCVYDVMCVRVCMCACMLQFCVCVWEYSVINKKGNCVGRQKYAVRVDLEKAQSQIVLIRLKHLKSAICTLYKSCGQRCASTDPVSCPGEKGDDG